MSQIKYYEIYKDLKAKIENETYGYQQLMPSEYTLIEEYSCSRNTIRRAIAELASKGYVQSIKGKGVIIIYKPYKQSEFFLDYTETFKESAIRNKKENKTVVVHFEELVIDEKISKKTSLPVGEEIYYIQRLRFIEGKPLILDHNYFLKSIAKDLTKEIAETSIYEYMENELKENIITTKRMITGKMATKLDEQFLDLNGYNCVIIVNNYTYNANGVMFEFTESRHVPEKFVFYDQSQRIKR